MRGLFFILFWAFIISVSAQSFDSTTYIDPYNTKLYQKFDSTIWEPSNQVAPRIENYNYFCDPISNSPYYFEWYNYNNNQNSIIYEQRYRRFNQCFTR